MSKSRENSLKSHEIYEKAVTEVVEDTFDKLLMNKALEKTDNISQAEALYVKYRIMAEKD